MMKKLAAVLVLVTVLFSSCALAEDLSGLTDDELEGLWLRVMAEMEKRGMNHAEIQPAEEAEKAVINDRVMEFFQYWSQNDLDGMLALCTAEWTESVEDSRMELFKILANRTPVSLEVVEIYGRAGDPERTVEAVSVIDRHNGLENRRYLIRVRLVQEADGQWHIDPRSLNQAEEAAAPEEPTEEPGGAAGETVLYYVPGGGEYYHLDQYCRRVNENYLPMQGQFLYSELNEEPYSGLKPCVICNAPERE